MTDQLANSNLVTFYGKMLTFSRIKLTTNDFEIIESQLAIVSPKKNSLIPIVIDCDVELDLEKLVDLLWNWGLQPIGVVKGTLDKQANKLKMALFPADSKRVKRVAKPVAEVAQTETTSLVNNLSDSKPIAPKPQLAETKESTGHDDTDNKDSDSKNNDAETSDNQAINTTTENTTQRDTESKTLATSTQTRTGLFGKVDSDKLFGEKITASDSNNIGKVAKNEFNSKVSSHQNSDKDSQKDAHTEDDKSESEKQAEEKIRRFSSRAEVIAKINEANKEKEVELKDDNSNDNSDDKSNSTEALEQPWQQKALKIDEKTTALIVDNPIVNSPTLNNSTVNEASVNKPTTNNSTSDDSVSNTSANEGSMAESTTDSTTDAPTQDSNDTKDNNKDNETTLNTQTDNADSKDKDNNDNDTLKTTDSNTDNTDRDKENEQKKAPELKEQKEVRVEYVTVYESEKITSRVYDQVLRSGQSVNHMGGDLILTNSVNDGAEAITEGSLHIYGRGMGRLVAGAKGDQGAQIFCQKFNPSLVSVSGTYMLRDNLPPEVIDKAVQVSYKEGEGLVFRVMDN